MPHQDLRHEHAMPMDRPQYERMADRVAKMRRDLRELDAELAALAASLLGSCPHVPRDLPRRVEIVADELGYLADSLRAARPAAGLVAH